MVRQRRAVLSANNTGLLPKQPSRTAARTIAPMAQSMAVESIDKIKVAYRL